MFPSKLELDAIYAERLREAEHFRMLRKIGTASLFERLRARVSSFGAGDSRKPEAVPARHTVRCDVSTANN